MIQTCFIRDPKSPQTNGICERFHKTLLDEFYRVAFRKKLYRRIEELQADLDAWLVEYNEQRPHQGRWCYGKTPMQTFIDTLPVAKEKWSPVHPASSWLRRRSIRLQHLHQPGHCNVGRNFAVWPARPAADMSTLRINPSLLRSARAKQQIEVIDRYLSILLPVDQQHGGRWFVDKATRSQRHSWTVVQEILKGVDLIDRCAGRE